MLVISRVILVLLLFLSQNSLAKEWSSHRQNMRDIESQISRLEVELQDKVDKKKSTKDRALIEENLQRIVDIHAELISLRKDLNNEIEHIKLDHKDKSDSLSLKESKKKLEENNNKFSMTPLNLKLDALIRKIQSKYASFVEEAEESEEMEEIEEVIKRKKLKRKDRNSEVYLRKKSKVKLIK